MLYRALRTIKFPFTKAVKNLLLHTVRIGSCNRARSVATRIVALLFRARAAHVTHETAEIVTSSNSQQQKYTHERAVFGGLPGAPAPLRPRRLSRLAVSKVVMLPMHSRRRDRGASVCPAAFACVRKEGSGCTNHFSLLHASNRRTIAFVPHICTACRLAPQLP